MKGFNFLRTSVLLVAALVSTSALSWDYVGKSGKFEKFIEDIETVHINQKAKAVKITATKSLNLQYCELFFGNGGSRFFDMGRIRKGSSDVIRLNNNRFIEKIKCAGSSASLYGSRARMEISVKKAQRQGRGRDRDRRRNRF